VAPRACRADAQHSRHPYYTHTHIAPGRARLFLGRIPALGVSTGRARPPAGACVDSAVVRHAFGTRARVRNLPRDDIEPSRHAQGEGWAFADRPPPRGTADDRSCAQPVADPPDQKRERDARTEPG